MDKLYERIYGIACELSKTESTYTRADLAYELQNEGIKKDSFELGKLVYETYLRFNKDDKIKKAFYNNEGSDQLVSDYKVDSLIEKNACDLLFPLLQNKLDKSAEKLDSLGNQVTHVMSDDIKVVTKNKILNTVMGTQGLTRVTAEAGVVFDGYSTLIETYNNAKHQVKSIIADFVSLRTQICDVYRKFSSLLIDTLGDGIKAKHPDLFDFDSIEWLDVKGMMKNVKLDYDMISEKCQVLISSIQEDFVKSLKSSLSACTQMENKQAGLLLAGLKMASHYIDANNRTTELKQDLVNLKNCVSHDATEIKGDMGRLMLIYKTMNDICIPKAEIFFRNSDAVFSSELQAVENAIYNGDGIKELKEQRDRLLSTCKQIEKEMTDEQLNIDVYTTRIAENNQILKGLKPKYDEAKESKPDKPFFAKNILTLGAAGKRYNRDVSDWYSACKQVILHYEDLMADVKIDTDELHVAEQSLVEDKERYASVKKELENLNRVINGKICVNKEIKAELFPHLEDIINLLRLAREIASTKLDPKYLKAVHIEKENLDVPEETKQNISKVTDTIMNGLDEDSKTNHKISELMPNLKNVLSEKKFNKLTKASKLIHGGVLTSVPENYKETVQKAAGLLQSMANLKAMQKKKVEADGKYEEKLKKLKDEFSKNMASIDDKSAVLLESLKKINTAQDKETLKEGLMELSDGEKNIFSDKDLDEFLKGNQKIEL